MALKGENSEKTDTKDANKDTNIAPDNVAFMGSMSKSGKKLDPNFTWINGNLWGYVSQLRVQLWVNLKSIDTKDVRFMVFIYVYLCLFCFICIFCNEF